MFSHVNRARSLETRFVVKWNSLKSTTGWKTQLTELFSENPHRSDYAFRSRGIIFYSQPFYWNSYRVLLNFNFQHTVCLYLFIPLFVISALHIKEYKLRRDASKRPRFELRPSPPRSVRPIGYSKASSESSNNKDKQVFQLRINYAPSAQCCCRLCRDCQCKNQS